VTLYPSRKKWLLVLAGSALFVVGSLWMIEVRPWMGWTGLIFFGAAALLAAAAMLPGAGALTLDREGFEAVNLFQGYRMRWQDVEGFQAARIPPAPQKFVIFDLKQGTNPLAKINAAIAGRNAALPDTYGLSADDLARLMAQWRERTTARTGAR
jgi:hypothetical protein